MSDTKHTPGPWRWSRTYEMDSGHFHWCLESDESAANGQTIDGSLVLLLNRDDYCGTPFLNNPNARLIAAAPDLLEACEVAFNALYDLIQSEFATSSDPHPADKDPDIAQLRAAIAKVKGEAAK